MRNVYLLLILAAALPPFASAQAAPANVPKTGQALCYDTTGWFVACTGTGQDGDLKTGVAWPDPRFVAGTGTGADCVTDNLTGLMWVKAPSTTPVTWDTALTDANGLTLCGFSDWRLPNVNELESLVNSEVPNQAAFLNSQGFSGVQAVSYWSSSSFFNLFGAWIVYMFNGIVGDDYKTGSNYVWPVRAGQ
jgi:hypothetical protein